MSSMDLARSYVFQLIVAAADRGFRSLDTFASWFLGGTAATFAFLIGNDEVSSFISASEVGAIFPRLVVAAGAILVAKFLGSLICAKAGAVEKSSEIREAWARRGLALPSEEDFRTAHSEAMPWIMKLIFRASPPTATRQAKTTLWCLMIAGLLSLLSAVIVITAWAELAALLL